MSFLIQPFLLCEKSEFAPKKSDLVWISHKIWSEIGLNFNNFSPNIKVCALHTKTYFELSWIELNKEKLNWIFVKLVS